MKYYTHFLKEQLREKYQRVLVSNAHRTIFQNIKYLMDFIKEEAVLNGIMNETCERFSFEFESKKYVEIEHFPKLAIQAAYSYQALVFYGELYEYNNLYSKLRLRTGDLILDNERYYIGELTNSFLKSIVDYLSDSLENTNLALYLLEKYKKRTEWFTHQKLLEAYKQATKNYEQIFEDDLRLFLFDQGIEYPFSTPKTPLGRADIVGELENPNPLIVEIKIWDSEKSYRINRVIEGFSAIVGYSNAYHKSVGYLVIFNCEQIEIEFELENPRKDFIPMIQIGEKSYFLIVVNLNFDTSASNLGKLKTVQIKESELTEGIE